MIPTIRLDVLARKVLWDAAQWIGYHVENETPFPFDAPSPQAKAESEALRVSSLVLKVVETMGPLPPPWWAQITSSANEGSNG